jgi:acyl carrier protein
MADLDDVKERVKKVTSDVLGVPVDQIEDDSRFVQDLHAESIQSIELVAGFEAEFDIEMDEDEALEVKTVGDAVTFIAKHVDEQAG